MNTKQSINADTMPTFAAGKLGGYTDGLQELSAKPEVSSWRAARRRVGFACVLGVMLLASSGCAEMWPVRSSDGQWLDKPTGQGLVADAKSPIPDVPMPHGFVALPAESSSRVSRDGLRTVVHMYQGRGTLADAVQFYRQQIKRGGWKVTGERASGGVTMIGGLKGRESLTVQISKPRVVNVVINIKPISTGSTVLPAGPPTKTGNPSQ